jgi:hypothetical protein
VRDIAMKQFAALLWKDFRNLRSFLVFLFITVTIAAGLFVAARIHNTIAPSHPYPLYFQAAEKYAFSCVYILMALLVFALTIEMYSQSVQSALSLPVRRFEIMLSKVLLITGAAFILVLLLVAVVWFLAWKPFYRQYFFHNYFFFDFNHLPEDPGAGGFRFCFWEDYLIYVRDLLPLQVLGMICVAQGVTAMVRRNRFAAWTMTFFALLFGYNLARIALLAHWTFGEFVSPARPAWVKLLDLEAGAVFLLVGLILFDRFAEA